MDLDDKTKISLYAVAAASPFIVGALIWLTSIDAKATLANQEAKNTRDLVLEIRDRLVRIEDRVNVIKRRGD